MKDVIKTQATREDLKGSEVTAAVLRHLGAAAAGFIAARGSITGGLLPFGLSAAAGCPQVYLPSVVCGAFIGYFIPAVGSGGFRYIAALLAILAIRLMLSSYKKTSENPVFLGGICLCAEYLTSAITLNGLPQGIISWLAEGLLAAGGAFFTSRACRAVRHYGAGLSSAELVSLMISINALILGLYDFSAYGVSAGRICGILLILAAAKYGGTLSGTVCGVVFTLFCALHGDGAGYSHYAAGGMLGGVFSAFGRLAQLAAVAASAIIGMAASEKAEGFAAAFSELFISSAAFLLLPRSAGITLGKLFTSSPRIIAPSSIKKALTMRLNMASGALCDVSETVEQVSGELARINAPDFGAVVSGIEQDACGGCKLRIHCWESKKNETMEAVLAMTKAVKGGEFFPAQFAPDEFKGRCLRPQRVGETVYRRYSEYAARIVAESRIEEVRNVVSQQFSGISDMLSDLAEDFENDGQFDNTAAENAAAALRELDLQAEECSSRIDRFGRMSIELKVKRDARTVLNRLQIMKAVSIACERDFDAPNISEVGGGIFISLSEHAAFRVEIGIGQICAARSNMCGDAYQYFNDGKGHFTVILSDGMGTGGMAAVDGAMASGLMARLLKAGLGYDCSLKILNSSMLFKSSDESLATVDIASIDLFTGEAELYKAGAAPTLVRRAGKTGKAVSGSLPIGILSEVGFDRAGIKLNHGDILLLMSDGATGEGTDWIRDELQAWRDGSAQDLAEHISECARRRRSDSHEDDITVIAAILEKAV